jgi:hypothetical protein
MLHNFHFSLERGVEMILDVVVGATGKELGDLGPSVSKLFVGLDNEHIFLLCPLVLLDIRV